MIKRTLNVTLTVSGPLLTRAAAVGPLGVDTSGASRKRPGGGAANDKVLYLPQTLVAGKIREAFVQLSSTTPAFPAAAELDALFGKETGKGSEGLRGALRVSDFYMRAEDCESLAQSRGRRHRIAIDKDRKSVQRGSLEVMDCPVPAGMTVEFSGTLSYFGQDDAQLGLRQAALHASLCWVAQLGANRTSGFGRLHDVLLEKAPDAGKAAGGGSLKTEDASPARVGLVLTFPAGDPFCVTERANRNYFESGEILSGAVIRGALAAALNQARGGGVRDCIDENLAGCPTLGRHFEVLRISHLFPSVGKETGFQRPIVPPLSLVKTKAGEDFCDVALIDNPGLVRVAGDGKKNHWAPEFDIDWKTRDNMDRAFGWPKRLPRELRVHNRHDPDRRRAMDEKLFAHLLTVPEVGHCWVGWLDLENLAEQEDREKLVEDLLGFLSTTELQIGKTKAPARLQLVDETRIQEPENRITSATGENADGKTCWVLTLQSQAILCNPHELSEKELLGVCDAQFKAFGLGSDIQLLRVFARQSLVGDYIANRYRGSGKPFLLFEPGSTFVFTADSSNAEAVDAANKLFYAWQGHGLPFPDWAKEAYARNGKGGDHWSNCPYIPQNGYGAVAINIDTHVSRKPTMKGCDS